eukprot:GILK01008103.1.p1 GENE.GILK01008103.1~~GILK01008103.1.p1  ORF type:complete len:230 (-),score=33.68 GILK01008103.1:163-852(-)
MGGIVAKPPRSILRRNEIQEYGKGTSLLDGHIEMLYVIFRVVAKSAVDDGVIDKTEFSHAIGVPLGPFFDRLFQVLDTNGDGVLNFREFVTALAILSVGTFEEKIKLSFSLYDSSRKGFIMREDLRMVVIDFFANLVDAPLLSSEQIDNIVEDTFRQTDKNRDGRIDLQEYRSLMKRHPNFAASFNVDIAYIVAMYTKNGHRKLEKRSRSFHAATELERRDTSASSASS